MRQCEDDPNISVYLASHIGYHLSLIMHCNSFNQCTNECVVSVCYLSTTRRRVDCYSCMLSAVCCRNRNWHLHESVCGSFHTDKKKQIRYRDTNIKTLMSLITTHSHLLDAGRWCHSRFIQKTHSQNYRTIANIYIFQNYPKYFQDHWHCKLLTVSLKNLKMC